MVYERRARGSAPAVVEPNGVTFKCRGHRLLFCDCPCTGPVFFWGGAAPRGG